MGSQAGSIFIKGGVVGVSKKGKRKIMIDGNVYWWFAEAGAGGEPVVHILADDHSFLADCNMYCSVLRITKDSRKGVRDLAIPFDVSDRYAAFAPKYIEELIRIGISDSFNTLGGE